MLTKASASTQGLTKTYYYSNYTELTKMTASEYGGTTRDYTYEHDNAGRLTRQVQNVFSPNSTTTYNYEWDALDRMTKVQRVTSGVTKTINYTYNAAGKRVRRDEQGTGASGVTKYWTYQGDNIASVSNHYLSGGQVTKDDYVYTVRPGRINNALERHKLNGNGSDSRYYQYDHRGNVASVTDANGKITKGYQYDAFGNIAFSFQTGQSGPATNDGDILFTGKDLDPDTGLYYFNARWYDPELGQYISRTDFDPDEEHPYAFCEDDPISYVDPDGLVSQAARDAASIGIGFLPVVGSAQSIVELISGYDYISGECVNRWLAAAGIAVGLIPFGKGLFKGGAKGAKRLSRFSKKGVGVCFVAGTLVQASEGATPIEQMEVGALVRTNQEKDGSEETISSTKSDKDHFSGICDGEEVNAETWRAVRLIQQQADASRSIVTYLRPTWWIERLGAREGARLQLDMPEVGAVGEFVVESVRRLDRIEPSRPGFRHVVGSFVHENAVVLDMTIQGESGRTGKSEVLGVTPDHPIWSVTRGEFLPAGELRPGELVQALRGPAQVLSIVPRPGRHTVYNLEVHGEHVYRVGNSGVLVHNNPCKANPRWEWKGKPGSTPGSRSGSWVDSQTGDTLRSDMHHGPPIGAHWGYQDADGKWWRLFLDDGRVEPK